MKSLRNMSVGKNLNEWITKEILDIMNEYNEITRYILRKIRETKENSGDLTILSLCIKTLKKW